MSVTGIKVCEYYTCSELFVQVISDRNWTTRKWIFCGQRKVDTDWQFMKKFIHRFISTKLLFTMIEKTGGKDFFFHLYILYSKNVVQQAEIIKIQKFRIQA